MGDGEASCPKQEIPGGSLLVPVRKIQDILRVEDAVIRQCRFKSLGRDWRENR
jgi:hypothetical protein